MKKTILLLFSAFTFLFGQILRGDVGAIIQECQKMKQIGTGSDFVWWMPPEFWEMSFKEGGGMSESEVNEFLKVFEGYTIFVLGSTQFDQEGKMSGASAAEIRKNTTLTVRGEDYEPLLPVEVSEELMALISVFKPQMLGSMGEMGELMELVVFPGEVDGNPLIDPKKEGGFKLTLFGNEYLWKLPLGSLLPKVVDPISGEEFPGNYKFNPFTGQKLGMSGKKHESGLGNVKFPDFNEFLPAERERSPFDLDEPSRKQFNYACDLSGEEVYGDIIRFLGTEWEPINPPAEKVEMFRNAMEEHGIYIIDSWGFRGVRQDGIRIAVTTSKHGLPDSGMIGVQITIFNPEGNLPDEIRGPRAKSNISSDSETMIERNRRELRRLSSDVGRGFRVPGLESRDVKPTNPHTREIDLDAKPKN